MKPLLASASAVLVLAASVAARAAEADAESDGAYGRLDGDVTVLLGAGAALASGGPMLDVEAGALYLSTAGAYFRYADALGADGPDVRRALAAGLELRPLFLARYASNAERGPARLDLLADSFAFQVGAWWDAHKGDGLGSEPGLEIGLGLDVPLFASATGPFVGVRGALRWRTVDLDGAGSGGTIDRGAFVSVVLAWHQVLDTHLVDAGDRVVR